MRGALAQVKVNQTLVWNANLLRDTFEVANRILIQTNGDLLLQLGSIRILASLCEIVFFSHGAPFIGIG